MAFLLLIFFLMTTTMNVDSGIQRRLPPIAPPDAEADVNKRNMMMVNVNQNNLIQINGEMVDITQVSERVKEHLSNPTDDPNMAAKKEEVIPLIGPYKVSEGVVSLMNHRSTSYNTYVQVQNELTRAINELRNDLANRQFGANFSELTEEQQQAITKAVPTAISEGEPKDLTTR